MKYFARTAATALLLTVGLQSAAYAKGGIYFAGPDVCGYSYAAAHMRCEGALVSDRWSGSWHVVHVVKGSPAAGLEWDTTSVMPYQMDVVVRKSEPGYWRYRIMAFLHIL